MFWSSAGRRGCVGLLRRWSFTVSTGTLTTPQCPPSSPRLFSVSAPLNWPTNAEPLRQWALEVKPFSTVRAQLGCSIFIRPLDLHKFPEADRVFIAAHGEDTERELGVDHLHVHYDDQSNELLVTGQKVNSSVSIDLTAPVKSNLFVTTRGRGNVQVEKMECDICKVQTEEGNCFLHAVKGHQIEVKSHGGHVTGVGTIHGDVDISTGGDGSVDVKKLQGTNMNVSTERGPLRVKAIYAKSSCVSSCSGSVQLGHVHGNATVQNMSGDTAIDGSNNFLKITSHSGDVDVYVGDGGSADIHTQEGDVCVRVPPSLKAGVELRGVSVDVSSEVVLNRTESRLAEGQITVIGYINGESAADQWVKVQAHRGSVRLKTQSWLESLKLGSYEGNKFSS